MGIVTSLLNAVTTLRSNRRSRRALNPIHDHRVTTIHTTFAAFARQGTTSNRLGLARASRVAFDVARERGTPRRCFPGRHVPHHTSERFELETLALHLRHGLPLRSRARRPALMAPVLALGPSLWAGMGLAAFWSFERSMVPSGLESSQYMFVQEVACTLYSWPTVGILWCSCR